MTETVAPPAVVYVDAATADLTARDYLNLYVPDVVAELVARQANDPGYQAGIDAAYTAGLDEHQARLAGALADSVALAIRLRRARALLDAFDAPGDADAVKELLDQLREAVDGRPHSNLSPEDTPTF